MKILILSSNDGRFPSVMICLSSECLLWWAACACGPWRWALPGSHQSPCQWRASEIGSLGRPSALRWRAAFLVVCHANPAVCAFSTPCLVHSLLAYCNQWGSSWRGIDHFLVSFLPAQTLLLRCHKSRTQRQTTQASPIWLQCWTGSHRRPRQRTLLASFCH